MLALERINIVSHGVLSFRNLSSEVDLLLVSSQLFLLDPAADGSELLFNCLLQSHDGLVLPLELSLDHGVHSVISVSHFFTFVLLLLQYHLVFDINLILHVINLAHSLLLFEKNSVDQISYLNLKLIAKVILHTSKHVSEVVIVLEINKFKLKEVFLFSAEIAFEIQHLLVNHQEPRFYFFNEL